MSNSLTLKWSIAYLVFYVHVQIWYKRQPREATRIADNEVAHENERIHSHGNTSR